MREQEFRDYLTNNLNLETASYWIRVCRRVQKVYNVCLDKIIQSEEQTQFLRRQIYDDETRLSPRQRRNFPSGVKKYYECFNEGDLPRLRRKNHYN